MGVGISFFLFPTLLLLPTNTVLATSSQSNELKHSESLLSKTHRMVLRAQKHGRKDKLRVFKQREDKLRDIVKSLREEGQGGSVTAQPVLIAKPRPTHSSTSPSPSKPPVYSTTLSTKKGLGFNRLTDYEPFSSTSWGYNWDSRLSQNERMIQGREFVPMLWKPDQDHLEHWKEDVEKSIKKGEVSHLLGFNEPDLEGQAWMTVEECVEGWREHLEPFAKKGLKLVSPAVTNGPAPKGVKFLEGFMNGAKAQGLTVDAIALHWYDSPTNVEYFKNYLQDAHNQFGLPIWLTEYGFTLGTQQEQIEFQKQVVPWMDQQPWNERYAAFGDFVGMFVDAQAKVLPVGNAYNSA
ncbi:hypothetical protein JCM5353_008576 [Sporobolomyces roseus]